jgi:HK97 family phage prohead protease
VIYKETPIATTARGRELIARLTCDALGRQQELVRAEGGRFTSPRPVLLNHDHTAIVGTLYRIEPERLSSGETCLRGHLRLLPPGTSKVADEAAALVEAGAIDAVSIGFVARQIDPGPPVTFVAWDLIEASLVGTPACPSCRIVQRAARDEIDATPTEVREMVTRVLPEVVKAAVAARVRSTRPLDRVWKHSL